MCGVCLMLDRFYNGAPREYKKTVLVVYLFFLTGTGGFSTRMASIGAYGSPYLEMVIAVFMLLFGCNFNLFYLLLLRQGRAVIRSEELRAYLGIILAAVVMITINIAKLCGGVLPGLRYAFFQVMTVISTTGFSTCDFDTWPVFSRGILVLLMFIGGCAGSTGGGIKVSRLIILLKSYMVELKRMIHPTQVKRIWFEDRTVSNQTVESVHVFFFVYLIIVGIGALIISLDGRDFTTNLTASIACISNIGPGLSAVGPTGNYAFFSAASKIVLCFEMLLGRLEIFPILFLVMPSVWRKRG